MYLGTTGCSDPSTGNAQSPTIVMAEDNESGLERWFFNPFTALTTLASGQYTIQNVGTANEHISACNTFLVRNSKF